MPKLIELTGEKIGDLTVIRKIQPDTTKTKYSIRWECLCVCGNTVSRTSSALISGVTHCGCKYVRGTHNRSHSKEYNSWRHIKARCINPKNKYYPRYGARGIKMCDRWLNSFQNFLDDMGYAPDNTKRYSVDRVDNNGDYEPSNCRWATYDDQANNRRTSHLITHQGKTMTLAQWCKELKLPYSRTGARLNNYGMSVEDAFRITKYK